MRCWTRGRVKREQVEFTGELPPPSDDDPITMMNKWLTSAPADLLRKLILAEPGGELDATLDPRPTNPAPPRWPRGSTSTEVIAEGDIDGGLQIFIDALEN